MNTPQAPQDTQAAEKRKNFTIIPNVLYDTCDLSDEARGLFEKLMRDCGHRGGVFYGSIRKLASTFHIGKDKAHRNLSILEQAGLVIIGSMSETGNTAIKLNLDELWELNNYYTDGCALPRWKNLTTTLETVRKTGQENNEKLSEITDNQSDKRDSLSQKQDTFVRKERQSVRCSERKVDTIRINIKDNTVNTIEDVRGKTSTTDKTSATASEKNESLSFSSSQSSKAETGKSVLTEEEQAVWEIWQAVKEGIPQRLTQTAIDHCKTLALYHPTLERALEVEAWATSKAIDTSHYYDDKVWQLGHWAHETPKWIAWKKKQEAKANKTNEQPKVRSLLSATPPMSPSSGTDLRQLISMGMAARKAAYVG